MRYSGVQEYSSLGDTLGSDVLSGGLRLAVCPPVRVFAHVVFS